MFWSTAIIKKNISSEKVGGTCFEKLGWPLLPSFALCFCSKDVIMLIGKSESPFPRKLWTTSTCSKLDKRG